MFITFLYMVIKKLILTMYHLLNMYDPAFAFIRFGIVW